MEFILIRENFGREKIKDFNHLTKYCFIIPLKLTGENSPLEKILVSHFIFPNKVLFATGGRYSYPIFLLGLGYEDYCAVLLRGRIILAASFQKFKMNPKR